MLGAFFTNFLCNDVTTQVAEFAKKKLCQTKTPKKKRARIVKLRIVVNRNVSENDGIVIDYRASMRTYVHAWINPSMWRAINQYPFQWRKEMETTLRKRMTGIMVECNLQFDGSIRYLATVNTNSLEMSFYYQTFDRSQEMVE